MNCTVEIAPGVRCGQKVGGGGDRCRKDGHRVLPGGDRKHSLHPRRQGSGVERTLLFNDRGKVVGGLKKKVKGGKKG